MPDFWKAVFDGAHPVLFVVVASWLLGVARRHGAKEGAEAERARLCSESAEAACSAYMLDERRAILRVAEEMTSLAHFQITLMPGFASSDPPALAGPTSVIVAEHQQRVQDAMFKIRAWRSR